jgi:hypothetical protein
MIHARGATTVRLNLEYESSPDEAIIPLSFLAIGLSQLTANRRPTGDTLTIETSEDSVDAEYEVRRFLTEKTVKRGNYIWRFHKSDPDPWPSALHGHDYEKGLKLDALDGRIYDVVTKECCKSLKARDLKIVQDELRTSSNFKTMVEILVDGLPAKPHPV